MKSDQGMTLDSLATLTNEEVFKCRNTVCMPIRRKQGLILQI